VQVLHLSNGTTLQEKLGKANNRVDQLVQSGHADYRIVEEVYLSALSRFPTDAELTGLMSFLSSASAADKRQVVEDLMWSVMSSREFLFNH
jgi:hypothetical protein